MTDDDSTIDHIQEQQLAAEAQLDHDHFIAMQDLERAMDALGNVQAWLDCAEWLKGRADYLVGQMEFERNCGAPPSNRLSLEVPLVEEIIEGMKNTASAIQIAIKRRD